MKIIAFFNHKGSVGKTTLVHHIAWMYADLGLTVVAADLDPQADLTTRFLEEERLYKLWPDGEHSQNILGTMSPILKGKDEIADIHLIPISDNIGLIVGDLGLSLLEKPFSEAWLRSLEGEEAAFRILSAFYRALLAAANQQKADVVLIDLGSNLSAINQAALIAADSVVIPLLSDKFSLQGLKDLGVRLREWREGWQARLKKNTVVELPRGLMQPAGYITLRHRVHSHRSITNYAYWMTQIPDVYHQFILNKSTPTQDEHCLSTLMPSWSLMQMAMEVHKPMFFLKPADGAMGTHALAVKDDYQEFKQLALKLAKACAVQMVTND